MPDLQSLGLSEQAAPAVDYDAPEMGQQPPVAYPGIYTFLFKMPEDKGSWFDKQEVEMVKGNPGSKRAFLVVHAVPAIIAYHASRDAAGQPVPVDADSGQPPQLPPQRFSFFKSDRMQISQGGELLRALGMRLNNIFAEIEPALTQVDGRVTFMGELGWRAFFQSTGTTVSTHPRKKKGEILWPRGADGQPELLAVNPATGEKAYGYPDIFKIVPPTASNGQ